MAGQDRFMNDFTPVQDATYIYAEDANGNQVKIKKSDLLSIVMQHRGTVDYNNPDEINNTSITGMYNHWGALAGTYGTYGVLVVFNTDSYVFQLDVSFDNKIFLRYSSNRGQSWSIWKSITLT